jgi:hypothetical protein
MDSTAVAEPVTVLKPPNESCGNAYLTSIGSPEADAQCKDTVSRKKLKVTMKTAAIIFDGAFAGGQGGCISILAKTKILKVLPIC